MRQLQRRAPAFAAAMWSRCVLRVVAAHRRQPSATLCRPRLGREALAHRHSAAPDSQQNFSDVTIARFQVLPAISPPRDRSFVGRLVLYPCPAVIFRCCASSRLLLGPPSPLFVIRHASRFVPALPFLRTSHLLPRSPSHSNHVAMATSALRLTAPETPEACAHGVVSQGRPVKI